MERSTKAEIVTNFHGDVVVLSFSGELDLCTCKKFREAFLSLDKGYRKVIFDFRETSYLDSEGLKVILQCRDEIMNQNGSVSMICGDRIKRTIFITKVDKLIPVCPSLEDAILLAAS